MEAKLLGLILFYIAYILGLGVLMFVKRFQAVKNKQVRGRYFKTYSGEVPDDLKVYGNHFNNQFQVPVIFFITCLAGIVLKMEESSFFGLACAFVVSRFAHTYYHLGSNHLLKRASIYALGLLIVLAMWVQLLCKASY